MWLRFSAAALCAWLVAGGVATAEPETSEKPAVRFRLPDHPRYVGTIATIDGGAVQLEQTDDGPAAREEGELTEGLCLALITKSAEESRAGNARWLRARIVEIGRNGSIVLEQSPEVAKQLTPGLLVAVFAPDASQEALAAIPELATLRIEAGSAQHSSQAVRHARLIGLALHNYTDIFKRLPPAVVYGPDGEPWHSWRVLILPFMDHVELYEKYRLDEPWNGPNNRRLLDQMPAAFGDPAHGENENYYAHFAAVTGDDAAFSAEGVRFDGTTESFDEALRSGRRLSAMVDGLSNTVIVGSVDPGREIPWMKPEDIVVGDDFPGIGVEGGFSAPHRIDGRNYGVFLFCDDSVKSVATDTDADLLRQWLAIADGELVDWDKAEAAFAPSNAQQGSASFIEYIDEEEGPVAVVSH